MVEKKFNSKDVAFNNRERIGFTGENNVCSMYLLDGKNPSIVVDSNNDIYIMAGVLMQMSSQTLLHNVDVECTEIYKLMNHTVNTDKTSKVGANYSLEVGGTHDVTVTGKQTITANGGQDVSVSGGDQNVTVRGNRSVSVYGGNMDEAIFGDKTTFITGKNNLTVTSECTWFKMGHFVNITVSLDEQIKLSNSLAVNIGTRENVNLAASETLNIGASVEQSLAIKRSYTAGLNFTNNMAVTIEKYNGVRTHKVGAADKFSAAMENIDCAIMIAEAKMANFAAKLIKLA